MKNKGLFIFVLIVFTVYFFVNFYIYRHGLPVLAGMRYAKPVFTAVFIFLSSLYIISKFLERTTFFRVARIVSMAGSFWLFVMFYLFLLFLLSDLIRLLDNMLHFIPIISGRDGHKINYYTGIVVLFVTLILTIAGAINASHPRIHKLNLKIAKKAGGLKKVRIALLSDIHIGILWTPKRTERMVNKINALKPDMVLFAGDILDEVIKPVIHFNTGKSLENIYAPLGIYAITGNHEYIGGIEKSVRYIESKKITFIRDSVVKAGDSFYIAGREDHDITRFTGRKRKELEELLSGVDFSLPVILLDHQPFNLDNAVKNKVDLELSGHTHDGQIWPLNYITSAIFELSNGYKETGNTRFYVSCGYGTWGPPVRIGNRPEIVCLEIEFE